MGTQWNRSGLIERDDNDDRTNAKAFFYNAGTTNAFQVFQDSAEGTPHAQPVQASNGRWPAVFIPFTVGYDVRVLDEHDTELYYFTNIPNPDPVDVSVTIAPEEKVQTGMIHAEMVNAPKSGYVRLNGRTLGNAASGATERANADTVNLFTYLWTNIADAQAPVSGGRGASAAADYAANKTIVLPSWQGTGPRGLDDMGAAAAGNFPAEVPFSSGNATTAASLAGANNHSLTIPQLASHDHTATSAAAGSHNHGGATATEAAHTHTGTTSAAGSHNHGGFSGGIDRSIDHTHGYTAPSGTTTAQAGAGVSVSNVPGGATSATASSAMDHLHAISSDGNHAHSFTSNAGSAHSHTISSDGSHSHTVTVNTNGSGSGHNNVARDRLCTWFIKL